MASTGRTAGAQGARYEVSEVEVGPVRLSVAMAGRGGRPLLLVHGFTGAKEDFTDWLGALADEGWWVVAPDLRGHGASDKPDAEDQYSLATFTADVRALVDGLGWSSYTLLGHSMGGMVAQELVLAEPDRIERLVLMDTDHGPIDGMDPALVALAVDVLRSQGMPALLALIEEAQPPERPPSEERVRASRPGYVEWGDQKLQDSAPAMYAAMAIELTTRPDRLADLAGVTVPTRVLVGEEDGSSFLAASRRMAEAIGPADLVVIPDAAHSPQFENPEAWWAAVAPFLAASEAVR